MGRVVRVIVRDLGTLGLILGRRIVTWMVTLRSAAAAFARGESSTSGRAALADMKEIAQAVETANQELSRQQAAATALAAVGRELAATLDVEQVTNRIVSSILELLGMSRSILYRVDRSADVLICVATAGDASAANWVGQRMAKGEGVSGRVLAEGRQISSNDVLSDPEIVVPGWTGDRILEERYRAVTSLPLRARGHILGVLSLGYQAGRVLTGPELELLSAFADQAAVAFENARLFQDSERRRCAAEGLAEVGALVSQSLDPHEVRQRIVDSIRSLLSARVAAVYRLDPQTDDLVALATSGISGVPEDRDLILSARVGAAGLAVHERHGVISADLLADPQIRVTHDFRAQIKQAGYRAALAVPMMVQGRVIGALGVGDRAGRVFDAEDIRIAQAFANQAAIAIENARLHEQTQERLVQSETLLAVGHQVSGTLDATEMMRRVAKEMGQALGADMVGAFLADADHVYLRPIAGYHVPKHLLADFLASPLPLKGHQIMEEAWEQRRAVASSDVSADRRVDPELVRRFPHRSNLFCPMIVQGEPIGGLFVTWFEREHRFTPQELRLVEGISQQAGIALANARLVDELKRRQARLEALLGVGGELSRIQPVEPLLTRIAETCGRLFDASSVGFRLVDGDELVLCGTWGVGAALMAYPRLKTTETLSGTVVATGEPLLVHDPVNDPRTSSAQREAYREVGVRAFLAVPVKIDERVIGVLTVRTCLEAGFSSADLDMARAFASQAAIAVENSRLYQETQRAFDELSRTKDQLVQAQKMEAIGQLAGGIAHDFNNLLTVISGRSQMFLLRLPCDDPMRRDAELIQKTSARAADLTRQLLAFSRKQVLQPKVLDLNALIEGLAPMLTRLIGEHLELVIVPGSSLGRVMADPGQLEQVIMNLVVNARDAMPDGGIIKIETEDRDLQDGVSHAQGQIPAGEYVALVVRDAGCGMDPATLMRIFEPFFTTKEPGKGTGLGLSTVYGIAHQSGGSIGVDSTVGSGTTVTIYLPRTAAPMETREARTGTALLDGGRETILLVEDEEDVRELASEILQGYGYTVVTAANPLHALAIAERIRGHIQLLVTDIVMPAMRGPTLAARLREIQPELRVLYISGYTDDMIGPHGTIEPAGAFLTKPFLPDALARAVRDALQVIDPGPVLS